MKLKVTDKDIFFKIKNHLLTQNERCMDDESKCLYHKSISSIDPQTGEEVNETLMCAVGCIINDFYYDYDFEYNSLDDQGIMEAIYASNKNWDVTDSSVSMLSALQRIHDFHRVELWEKALDEDNFYFGLDGDYKGAAYV